MKKIILLFIIALLFSSFQCSKKEFYANIEPPKLKVDETIPSQKLELITKFKLQETENTILSDISDLKLYPDGNKFLIIDPTNRTANVYDYETGKLLHWLKADNALTKFVSHKDTAPFYNKYYQKEIKRPKFEDYELYLDKDYIKHAFLNSFYKAQFIDSSIYLLTIVYYLQIVDNKFKVGANCTILTKVNYNLLLEDTIYLYPQRYVAYAYPNNFFYDEVNSKFIISSENQGRTYYEKKYDSLPDYSIYSKNGKFIGIYSFLPAKLSKAYLNYLFYEYSNNIKIKDKIIFSTENDLTLYYYNNSLNKAKLFDIYNLPSNNDSGFYYYPKIITYLNQTNRNTIENRSFFIKKLFPISIYNLTNCNNNLLIRTIVLDSTKNIAYYSILQEYTLDGKLLSQTKLNEDRNNQIKWIAFDNKNNLLLIIRRSMSGWYLEKRKWEKL